MWQFILDFAVALVFIYSARILWKIANRKKTKQLRLLFRTISIFIIAHLILFPIIYTLLINQNGQSIKIEKGIIINERIGELEKANMLKGEIEKMLIKEQKPLLAMLVRDHSNQLFKIQWDSIDSKRIVKIDSYLIRGTTEKVQIPGGDFYKEIEIYDSKGLKLLDFISKSEERNLLGIFTEKLEAIDNRANLEKKRVVEKFEQIEKNQFWNYRQILPYTMNILFTDNFNPQSRTANLIYFIHTIVVVGFLLTLMVNLFQFYLLNIK